MATAASAKIPLRDAIATAEQHLQGKAVRADFETENGSPGEYEIKVVAGAKVFDVRIDADKGTVIATKEHKADSDDDDKEAD
ncbi:MAG: PepSY domain-containing protein [Proteobacteria bacterium]|nr:PepSY domain-containing protein [Pseudomonadota bacterium]